MNCPICKSEPELAHEIDSMLDGEVNWGKCLVACPHCLSMQTSLCETEEEAWEEWEQLCEEPNK